MVFRAIRMRRLDEGQQGADSPPQADGLVDAQAGKERLQPRRHEEKRRVFRRNWRGLASPPR